MGIDGVGSCDGVFRESFDVIGTVGFGVDFGTRKDITKAATTGFTPDGDVFRVFKGVLSEVFKMNQNPLRQFLLFLPVSLHLPPAHKPP